MRGAAASRSSSAGGSPAAGSWVPRLACPTVFSARLDEPAAGRSPVRGTAGQASSGTRRPRGVVPIRAEDAVAIVLLVVLGVRSASRNIRCGCSWPLWTSSSTPRKAGSKRVNFDLQPRTAQGMPRLGRKLIDGELVVAAAGVEDDASVRSQRPYGLRFAEGGGLRGVAAHPETTRCPPASCAVSAQAEGRPAACGSRLAGTLSTSGRAVRRRGGFCRLFGDSGPGAASSSSQGRVIGRESAVVERFQANAVAVVEQAAIARDQPQGNQGSSAYRSH